MGRKKVDYERLLATEFEITDSFFEGTACIHWTDRISNGYGVVRVDGVDRVVHRLLWVKKHGEPPVGFVLDHRCHVPGECMPARAIDCPHRRCRNLLHLAAVPRGDNTLRGNGLAAANRLKTHCPQGHPYDVENTRITPSTGERVCRTCVLTRQRAAYAESKTNGKYDEWYAKIKAKRPPAGPLPTPTHCKSGHPWTEESSMWKKDGRRRCRICTNERERKRMAANRVKSRQHVPQATQEHQSA